MSDDAAILDYGRPQRQPPSMRWLVLLFVWTIGLAVWVLYFITIGYAILRLL